MMNKCTEYWLDHFVRTMATCKTILPRFISMENNLTVTIIVHYMDGSDQWHTMYKSKHVIPSKLVITFCVKLNSVSVVYH